MRSLSKYAAGLLALLMTVLAAVSCADGAGNTDITTAPEASAAGTTEAPPETDKYEIGDNLPVLNYGGETINILSRDHDWFRDEIKVDADDGDVVHSAIFRRNLLVEERLGVSIENKQVGGDAYQISEDHLRKQMSGGLNEYSLVSCSVYASIIHTNENLYYDLKRLEHLDLSRPYWSQGFNEAVEYKGAQFMATGAALLSPYRLAFVTFFNREMFDAANTPYPYEAVRNHEWTLDYQYSLVERFYKDVNGNQKGDADDIFGFMSNNDMIGVDPYWSACDLRILDRNADGEYEYAVDTERLGLAIDKILRLYYDNPGSWPVLNKSSDGEQKDIAKKFSESGAAMVTLRLIEVEGEYMKDMKADRGIVPIPMLDTDQSGYKSYVHDQMTVLAVPNTNKTEEELSMLGAVLEALASESYKYVTPAYYELALKAKYSNDPESIEMLDLITENIFLDPGVIYTKAIESVHQKLRTCIGAKAKIMTTFKQNKALTTAIQKLNEGLDETIATYS